MVVEFTNEYENELMKVDQGRDWDWDSRRLRSDGGWDGIKCQWTLHKYYGNFLLESIAKSSLDIQPRQYYTLLSLIECARAAGYSQI